MRDTDAPLGYKAVDKDGKLIKPFDHKGEVISFVKHPSSRHKFPGLSARAVWGDETGVREEVVA